MLRVLVTLAVLALPACSLFDPGPSGEPSPAEAGFRAAGDTVGAPNGDLIGWAVGTLGAAIVAGVGAAVRQAKKNKKMEKEIEDVRLTVKNGNS